MDLAVTNNWLKLLGKYKAIAVIRTDRLDLGLAMAKAVAEGGIGLIEITWNSQQPEELVSTVKAELPQCIIGAGTILNLEQLERAIASGAQFLFSPHVEPTMIEAAVTDYRVPIVPGALTPTEIVKAWQAGASAVKVFPVEAMGGASYLRSLQAPLKHIPLIPTGGITLDNAGSILAAGAVAVGLSSQLFSPPLVAQQDWQAITARTQTLLANLNAATQNKQAN